MKITPRARLAAALITLVAGGLMVPASAMAITSIVVNTTQDGSVPGKTTLRQAIDRANGSQPGDSDEIILAADTVVAVDGAVLGKPRDPDDAASMLRRLSGRGHRVITAVATNRGGVLRWGHAATGVTFRTLEPGEIARYVAGGEPLDKAGGYAIQGGAAAFVEAVDGDRDTVIGLPMALVRRLLALP